MHSNIRIDLSQMAQTVGAHLHVNQVHIFGLQPENKFLCEMVIHWRPDQRKALTCLTPRGATVAEALGPTGWTLEMGV
jgi:hypothetical protein